MTPTPASPLLGVRAARRSFQVVWRPPDDGREAAWSARCAGCGRATERVQARTGRVRPAERGAGDGDEITLRVPLCADCAARDARDQALMLGAALTAGLFVVEALWRRLGGAGALAMGLVGFLVASAVALAVGPLPALSIATTARGALVLSFRRRDAARDFIEANATDAAETSALVAGLERR